MPAFKKVYTVYPKIHRRESYRSGFYHPISILILALITLTVALAIFVNSGFFANKNVPTPASPTPLLSPKPSPKSSPTDATANWKTYTHTKDGYQINYPKSWIISLDPSGNLDIASPDYKKGPGKMTDGIEVIAGTTIRINKLTFSGNSTLEQLADGVPGSVLGKKEITINNQLAIATDFTYGATSLTQVTVLGKGNAYFSIVRMYPPSQKNDFGGVFDQILSTFQFTN